MDLGVDNLCAIASNQDDFQPIVINGRPLKSINQFYNKRKAELQSRLKGNRKTSNRIQRMTDKRNRQVDLYLHTASKRIIDILVSEKIGVLVIGKNDGWKQEINIGQRNNQTFTNLPHARFIEMVTYKAEQVGIKVHVTERKRATRPRPHSLTAKNLLSTNLTQVGG